MIQDIVSHYFATTFRTSVFHTTVGRVDSQSTNSILNTKDEYKHETILRVSIKEV